jgi:mRNA interferase HigB
MQPMRLISNKALVDFAAEHSDAGLALQIWRKLIETGSYNNFADLKRTFASVDRVSSFFVFDIGGNKFRLVCAVHFNRQMVFIRHVFTHKEYDKWKP